MKTLFLGKLFTWNKADSKWLVSYCNWDNLAVYPSWIKNTIEHILVGRRYKDVFHTNCKSLYKQCKH